jgi:hypothetical protein
MAETVERLLIVLPNFIIMAKMIRPGLEGSMMSLTSTVVYLNMYFIRNGLGVLIN